MENGGRTYGEPQKIQANRKVLETTCSICQGGFRLTEVVYQCPSCGGYHHVSCWDAAHQCSPTTSPPIATIRAADTVKPAIASTEGFSAPALPQTPGRAPADLECPQCGAINPLTAALCNCGYAFQSTSPASKLEATLSPDERHCPSCYEVIKVQALKCRFCGLALNSRLVESVTESSVANPPGLHWLLVLLLSLVTCWLFALIWGFRQAYWAKKVDSSSKALLYLILYLVVIVMAEVLSANEDLQGLAGILNIGAIVLFQVGNFSIKSTIESYYNTQLSGVMTFFFSFIYFQYHFNQIAKGRQSGLSILST